MSTDTTAMQDIVLYLRQVRTENAQERDLALKRALEKSIELLSKEKEQIEKAYFDGVERELNGDAISPQEYFKQTYPNP